MDDPNSAFDAGFRREAFTPLGRDLESSWMSRCLRMAASIKLGATAIADWVDVVRLNPASKIELIERFNPGWRDLFESEAL